MQLSAIVIAFVLSIPAAIINVAVSNTIRVNMAKKANRVDNWECGTGIPFILTGSTALGCSNL